MEDLNAAVQLTLGDPRIERGYDGAAIPWTDVSKSSDRGSGSHHAA